MDERVGQGYGCDLSISVETAQEAYRAPESPVLGALDRAMAAGFGVGQVGRMGNAGGGPAELLAAGAATPAHL